jgi:DNA-binding response OmpR family regulator
MRIARVNRILLVDDEKSIVFAVRQYFLKRGYVVDCAGTSEQALEFLAGHHYAVAIVDVELRGSRDSADGLNLAQFIRSHAPTTAIIILTALETPETETRAKAAGVHSFLHKPTRLAHIADVALGLMRDVAALAN